MMKKFKYILKKSILLWWIVFLLWPGSTNSQPPVTGEKNIRTDALYEPCDPIHTFPYSESFSLQPQCWINRDNLSKGRIWKFGSFQNGLAGSDGHYAYLDCWGYGPGVPCDGDLISPVLNLIGYQSARLSFTYTYHHIACSAMARLMLSTDGGKTWQVLREWIRLSSFNPDYVNLAIDQAAGAAEVLIKWNFVGDSGFYWSIDDVVVTAEPLPDGYPVVQTLDAQVQPAGIILQAQLHYGGDSPVFASGFLVSKHPFPEREMEQVLDFPAGPLAFEGLFTSRAELENSTRYYVRAYAENARGISYGATVPMETISDFRVPFLESFETPSLPDYWQVINHMVPVHNQWEILPVQEDQYANIQGNAAQITYNPSCNRPLDAELISPVIRTIKADYTEISFSHWHRGCYNTISTFYYSLDGGINWILAEVWAVDGNRGRPFSLILKNLTGNEKLQLKWHDQSSRCNWVIDNVQVKPIKMHELMIAVQGGGKVDPPAGNYLLREGTEMLISAYGPSQWVFREWMITDYPRIIYPLVRVIMEKDLRVLAIFDPAEPLSDDHDNSRRILVYPNPAIDRIFLNFQTLERGVHIEVISLYGELLVSLKLEEVQNTLIRIPINEFPKGLCLVRITSDQGVVLKKVLVI